MAGERGPVHLSTVEVGSSISLVGQTDYLDEVSHIGGIVTGREGRETYVRIVSPKVIADGAHIRLVVSEYQDLKVFNWGKPVKYHTSIGYSLERAVSGRAGRVLPPGIL